VVGVVIVATLPAVADLADGLVVCADAS